MYWAYRFTDWITLWAHSVSLDCLTGPLLTFGLSSSPQYESPSARIWNALRFVSIVRITHLAISVEILQVSEYDLTRNPELSHKIKD